MYKAKEIKCRKTLASLRRVRFNKDNDERDAWFDLKSAIVSCAVEDEVPRERVQQTKVV